ncbi:GNAT family N-acetyltransferase [Cohnella suwonensis]|uniref:GNAT family N-acetyltransferase n=1 Tax=Cohnella suwonensis TaxID=696072 RepID=A0ABW0LV67_9BACL
MKAYKSLSQGFYELDRYRISVLRFEDMRYIKQWRNEQIDVLRQNKKLTDEDQARYYEQVVLPSLEMENPSLMLFGYFWDNLLIGYGGLTNMDWCSLRAEVSFLVSTERISDEKLYESDFRHFLRLLKRVAFEDLRFNRLFTETFDIRPKHVAILEAEGFRFEGRMKQHVRIDGRFVDSLLHGCLKEHYDAEREKNIR